MVLGMARLFDGAAPRAIVPLAHGLTLNPNDPQNIAWYNLLAYAHLLADEPHEALASANRALAIRPIFRPTFEALVCCAAALGRLDDARRWLACMKELDGPESHFAAPMKRNNPHYEARIAEMFRRVTGLSVLRQQAGHLAGGGSAEDRT